MSRTSSLDGDNKCIQNFCGETAFWKMFTAKIKMRQ
jgi:hypothetical protein